MESIMKNLKVCVIFLVTISATQLVLAEEKQEVPPSPEEICKRHDEKHSFLVIGSHFT